MGLKNNHLTSKAKGGPLDNVTLSAGPSWDGRVKDFSAGDEGAVTRFHPGRYVWLRVKRTWTWVPAEPTSRDARQTPRGVYTIRSRKPKPPAPNA